MSQGGYLMIVWVTVTAEKGKMGNLGPRERKEDFFSFLAPAISLPPPILVSPITYSRLRVAS